jgi:histone H2A
MPTGDIEEINFNAYIYRVLKLVHPDTGMSGAGLSTMDALVKINIIRIMKAVNQFYTRSSKKTVTSREIQSAVRLVLPGELAKHAVSEGTKAVTKYNAALTEPAPNRDDVPQKKAAFGGKNKKKPEQRSKKAGIFFNVSRVEKMMMIESNAERKGAGAAVYLAAVCEYLTAEILELAGNYARETGKHRITPRAIKVAILNDEELSKLYQDTVIPGGVVPHIHHSLLPEKKEKKPKAPKVQEVGTKSAKKPAKKPTKKTTKKSTKSKKT